MTFIKYQLVIIFADGNVSDLAYAIEYVFVGDLFRTLDDAVLNYKSLVKSHSYMDELGEFSNDEELRKVLRDYAEKLEKSFHVDIKIHN